MSKTQQIKYHTASHRPRFSLWLRSAPAPVPVLDWPRERFRRGARSVLSRPRSLPKAGAPRWRAATLRVFHVARWCATSGTTLFDAAPFHRRVCAGAKSSSRTRTPTHSSRSPRSPQPNICWRASDARATTERRNHRRARACCAMLADMRVCVRVRHEFAPTRRSVRAPCRAGVAGAGTHATARRHPVQC